MSKSGTDVLEKTKDALQKSDDSQQTALDERTHHLEQLTHQMEERFKQTLREIGASKELEVEAKELSHDMARRIQRLSQTVHSESVLNKLAFEEISSAVNYLKNKAKREELKTKKEKEEQKRKAKEKQTTRHKEESPETKNVTQAVQELTHEEKSDTKTTVFNKDQQLKSPTDLKKTIGKTTVSQSISPQTTEKKSDTLSPFAPNVDVTKKHLEISKEITDHQQTPIKKSVDSAELFRHQLSRSLENPDDYLKDKAVQKIRQKLGLSDPSNTFRSKVANALEDPNEYFENKLKNMGKKTLTRVIGGPQKRNSKLSEKINNRNKQDENQEKRTGVPLSTLFTKRKTIPPTQEDMEIIETASEPQDRGADATGNPRMQNTTVYSGTPQDPGSDTYSVRRQNNAQPNANQAADAGGGGGGSRRRKKRKKIAEKFENQVMNRVGRELLFAILKSPIFWGIAGAILLLVFIIVLLVGEGNDQQQNNPSNLLSITKTGPPTATVGQDLVYTINVGYQAAAEDLTIIDKIPLGVNYVSSSPAGTYDDVARTVTWNAKALAMTLANPVNVSVTVTLRTTQNNIALVNQATASVLAAASSGNYIAPSANNCGGQYTSAISRNPTKLNFGDPSCTFTKDALYTQLLANDPANADLWFNTVIPCESGYNPNAYAGPQTGTPDAAGAWGLYQMGSSTPPGSPLSSPGKNGPNDRGDVPWPIQTSNATTYGKSLPSLGAYWACARNNRAN